jgi:hypothetical protein
LRYSTFIGNDFPFLSFFIFIISFSLIDEFLFELIQSLILNGFFISSQLISDQDLFQYLSISDLHIFDEIDSLISSNELLTSVVDQIDSLIPSLHLEIKQFQQKDSSYVCFSDRRYYSQTDEIFTHPIHLKINVKALFRNLNLLHSSFSNIFVLS